MLKTAFSFCLFLSVSLTLRGQNFKYEAAVTGIKEDTLYKLALTPELKRCVSNDLHDLRIFDSLGNEVPFVHISEPLRKEKQDLIPCEIISQEHLAGYSEIVIKNSAKDKISNLAFNITNSDAHKYCAVEGSEDSKQWFSVSALQELSLAYASDYTNSYKCIYFPLTDYVYYRLRVEDWNSEPLKINSAGYFKNSVMAGRLNDVPFKKEVKEDAGRKITCIRLSFDHHPQISRIDFQISEPRLYRRHVSIYANKTERQKHKTIYYKDVLVEFDMASDKPLLFDVSGLDEKELFLEIENQDNPPLVIESIRCKQAAEYLVGDFKAGNRYVLKCGNMQLHAPEYDLVNFVSTSPQLMPEAGIGKLKEIVVPKPALVERAPSFFETKTFLWLCLALGAVVILFFSVTLLKDMGKNPRGSDS